MKSFKQLMEEIREARQLDLFNAEKPAEKPSKQYEIGLTNHLNHLLDRHGTEEQGISPNATGNIVDDHAREDAKKIYDHHKDKIVPGMKAFHTGESQKKISDITGYDKKEIESSADIIIRHPQHDRTKPDENKHIGIQAKYAKSTPSLRKMELGPMLGLVRSGIFPKETDKAELGKKRERLFKKISPAITSRLRAALPSGRKSEEFKKTRKPVREGLLNLFTKSFNRLPDLEKKRKSIRRMTRSDRTPGLDEVTVRRFGSGKSKSEVYNHHDMWDNALSSFGHDIEARREGGGIRFYGKSHPDDPGTHIATYTPNTSSSGDKELGDVKETTRVSKFKK